MVGIRNESDFRNWFKENYNKLGFSDIVSSNSKSCPDFIMLENGENVKVELEVKSSNFILHNHSLEDVDKVICVINDVELPIQTIEVEELEIIKFNEVSPYSFSELAKGLFENNKVLTTSEVAKNLAINVGTAERALMELLIEGKVDRIKKTGVNLWILR